MIYIESKKILDRDEILNYVGLRKLFLKVVNVFSNIRKNEKFNYIDYYNSDVIINSFDKNNFISIKLLVSMES